MTESFIKELIIRTIEKKSSFEKIKNLIGNIIYQTCCQIFETLEDNQLIIGNGHHIAQEFEKKAFEILKKSWIKKEEK